MPKHGAEPELAISIVIPAFNEAARISAVLSAVRPFVDELIVVDDASRDGTGKLARQAGAVVLVNAQNQGYIAALRTGIAAARGGVIVTFDADGELPAELIPQLVEPIRAGMADMVQGHRGRIVRPSEQFLTWLAGLKGPVGDSGTGLRAIRADIAKRLELKGACICGTLALEVLALGGCISEIDVELQQIDKPRRIAWFHVRQFFYLLPWLFKSYKN